MTAKESLPGDRDILQVALIMFAVMSLATTEFIKDAFPLWDALRPSKMIVVYLIIIVQLIPAAILLGADRFFWASDYPHPDHTGDYLKAPEENVARMSDAARISFLGESVRSAYRL